MTAIHSKIQMSQSLPAPPPPPQAPGLRLSLVWPIAPEGLCHAARFAGLASVAVARIVCCVEDDHLALSLACWHDPLSLLPPIHSIPLIRCCTPDVRIIIDEAENMCHVDAPGIAAISCTFHHMHSATLEPDMILYARTTVAERIGLPTATLERAVQIRI